MRVFAGPNGSGKSTIFEGISNNFDVGYYINADEIEKKLISDNQIDLTEFGIDTEQSKHFQRLISNHSIAKKAIKDGYVMDLRVEGSFIKNPNGKTHSYEAALIADFLRSQLIQAGQKLSFETVMSHESKLDIFDTARQAGYKNYLYFICTESADINVSRVAQRVASGGHPVMEEKIINRYERTLSLLKDAVKRTYRSFIWDNSGKKPNLILEVFEGDKVTFATNKIPLWVDKYLLS